MCRRADGAILLVFRRAPDHRWLLGEERSKGFDQVDHLHFKSHLCSMIFAPDLSVMAPARSLPTHGFLVDQDANLLSLRDGRILLGSFYWMPVIQDIAKELSDKKQATFRHRDGHGPHYSFWGGFTRFSDDGGANWFDSVELPRAMKVGAWGNHASASGAAALRGRMIELADGRLIMAGYCGPRGEGHGDGIFYVSSDRGESWSEASARLRCDQSAVLEPSLTLLPDNKIAVYARSTMTTDQVLATVFSADALEGDDIFLDPCPVIGHPCDPLILDDGNVLLSYGYRHQPYGVRARILPVGDVTRVGKEIIIHDSSPSPDTGYPWAVKLQNRHILLAYYAADSAGIRGIDAVILEY